MIVKELWRNGNMTNGDEIPKTVKRTVKGRSEFPMWVWGLLAVMLIAGLAIYAGVTFVQPGTPQVAISGSGSPAGPAGPAPTLQPSKIVDFNQLVKTLDTPEKIRDFMVNYPFEHVEHRGPSYEPQELLQHDGKGKNDSFADFFATALKSQGCQWNPRLYFFDMFTERGGEYIARDVVLIAFHDTRDGNNKYFVADPELKFPIYNMGKATDPIAFEEARRGGVRDTSRAGMGEDYCEFERGK